jgi:hypothetical protein
MARRLRFRVRGETGVRSASEMPCTGSGRPIINRPQVDNLPHNLRSLVHMASEMPCTGSGRPIINRPQVGNLPHNLRSLVHMAVSRKLSKVSSLVHMAAEPKAGGACGAGCQPAADW